MFWMISLGCPWVSPDRHFGDEQTPPPDPDAPAGGSTVELPGSDPQSSDPGSTTPSPDATTTHTTTPPATTVPIVEVRDPGPFVAIVHEATIEVVVHPAADHAVEIVCPEDLIDLVETYVVGDELRIETLPAPPGRSWSGCSVAVDAPSLAEVWIGRSGDLRLIGLWSGLASATVDSSGDLAIEQLDGGSCVFDLRSSGWVEVTSGALGSLTAVSSSSGGIDAQGLVASDATIDVGGSGDVELTVMQTATVSITSSGDVTLWGGPTVDLTDDGSGELILP